MHRKYKDLRVLEKKLIPFIGGQFQLEAASDTYRGTVVSFEITGVGKENLIKVRLSGYFKLIIVFVDNATRTAHFKGVEPTFSSRIEETFCCDYYYLQESKGRIKIRTDSGEVVRFFLPNSSSDLVPNDDGEYYSKCSIKDYIKILTIPISFSQK